MSALLHQVLETYQNALCDSLTLLDTFRAQNERLREESDRKTLLSLDEVASYLKKSKNTVHYYYTELGLPYVRKGRNGLWFVKGEVDDWLKSGKCNQHTA